MLYDQTDIENLALVTWKEARGEGHVGMQAVMHVIVNRVGAVGFPKTLHDVIYQRNAFTSMSVPSDPEYNLKAIAGDIQYAYCESLAVQVLNVADVDPTYGSCYYANLKNVTSGWFFNHIVNDSVNHPLKAVIGKQSFYL